MIIHCIGDSHTWQFIGKLPENLRVFDNVINYKNVFHSNIIYNNINFTFYGYRCCEDGAYAYNIEKRKDIFDKILSNTNKTDILMFMFGEVDCRYKIKSQMLKNNSTIEDEVKNVVDRYFEFIRTYNINHNRKIIIWGPHPQHTSPTHCYIDCFDSEERNTITKIFNQQLESLAKKENYLFISIFNQLVEKPDLNTFFLDDTIHIKPCHEILGSYLHQILTQLQ
jgi:hypothetical protein